MDESPRDASRVKSQWGLAYRTRLKRTRPSTRQNYATPQQRPSKARSSMANSQHRPMNSCSNKGAPGHRSSSIRARNSNERLLPNNGSPSKWTLDVCGDVHSLELATTARDRLKGLLFTDPDDVTRLLIPCHDVHTYGMRYPLDIAFISRDGVVLDVHRNVAASRRMRNGPACPDYRSENL